MLSVKQYLKLFLIISSFAMLSGCQTLSSWFGVGNKRPTIETGELPLRSNIEKHAFTLAEGQKLVGEIASVKTHANDTLPDLARHFGLSYNDITEANVGIDPWVPKENSRVLLPLQFIVPNAPRKGLVLNTANMRLFYYPRGEKGKVYTYPVGIGRDGWNTPMGTTSIAVKTPNPDWHVPPSIHREHAAKGHILPSVVRSGPDNPLGYYAMRLAIGSYLIHGTNKPFGIGMQISHGCVQMYPEDIEKLYPKVAVGTPVKVVHEPYLAAWHDNMLYLEANNPIGNKIFAKTQLQKQISREIKKIARQHNATVDWAKVDRVFAHADGVPTPILVNSPDIQELRTKATLLSRPEKLNGQPEITALTDNDWAMLVASYDTENEAKTLAAMLNHQGPPIPARTVELNNRFQVIAGPFKSKSEAKAVASRIRFDFEMEVQLIKPRTTPDLRMTKQAANRQF